MLASSMRLLVALLIAPLLLAPVRLKDSTPSFFTPPAKGPAPESYSLPAAAPLTTPTVIMVSPTLIPLVSETLPAAEVSPSLNLPQPVEEPAPPVPLSRPAPTPVSARTSYGDGDFTRQLRTKASCARS
jgi:hypothetical protein